MDKNLGGFPTDLNLLEALRETYHLLAICISALFGRSCQIGALRGGILSDRS